MINKNCHEVAEIGRQAQELLGDDRLLTALAFGCHIETADKIAGISERTAYRRLADSEFRFQLESARESLRQAILARREFKKFTSRVVPITHANVTH